MDILMRLAGYSSGYTPRSGYPHWFELQTVVWPRGDRQAIKGQLQDLSVTRDQDAMSMILAQLCAEGRVIREVLIDGVSDEGRRNIRTTLEQALVSSWAQVGGADKPLEMLTFSSTRWKIEYFGA